MFNYVTSRFDNFLDLSNSEEFNKRLIVHSEHGKQNNTANSDAHLYASDDEEYWPSQTSDQSNEFDYGSESDDDDEDFSYEEILEKISDFDSSIEEENEVELSETYGDNDTEESCLADRDIKVLPTQDDENESNPSTWKKVLILTLALSLIVAPPLAMLMALPACTLIKHSQTPESLTNSTALAIIPTHSTVFQQPIYQNINQTVASATTNSHFPSSLSNCSIIQTIVQGQLGSHVSKTTKQSVQTAIQYTQPTIENESKQLLKKIGKDFDQTSWIEKLNPNPPRPQESYPINMKLAQEWIDGHIGKTARHIAQTIIKHTRHISQQEFEEQLQKTVEDFNHVLMQLTEHEREYVIIVQTPKRSGFWVAELALEHLKVPPVNVVRGDNFKAFISGNPHIKKVILFDDAIYSGSQIQGRIEDIQEGYEAAWKRLDDKDKELIDYTIYVAVPFIRDKESVIPNPIAEKNIHILHTNEIKPICSYMTLEESIQFNQMYPGETIYHKDKLIHACNKLALYFDHKRADKVSIIERVYNGFPADDISTWSERIEDALSALKKWKFQKAVDILWSPVNSVFIRSFVPSPIPPYKTQS